MQEDEGFDASKIPEEFRKLSLHDNPILKPAKAKKAKGGKTPKGSSSTNPIPPKLSAGNYVGGRTWHKALVVEECGQFKFTKDLSSKSGDTPTFFDGQTFRMYIPRQVQAKGKNLVTNPTVDEVRIHVMATAVMKVNTTPYRILVIRMQTPVDAQWEGPFNILATRMPRPECYNHEDTAPMDGYLLNTHMHVTHPCPPESLSRRLSHGVARKPMQHRAKVVEDATSASTSEDDAGDEGDDPNDDDDDVTMVDPPQPEPPETRSARSTPTVPPTTPKPPKRKMTPPTKAKKDKKYRTSHQTEEMPPMTGGQQTEINTFFREQLKKSEDLAADALRHTAEERKAQIADAKEERKSQLDLFRTTLQMLASNKPPVALDPTPEAQAQPPSPYTFPGQPQPPSHYHAHYNNRPTMYLQQPHPPQQANPPQHALMHHAPMPQHNPYLHYTPQVHHPTHQHPMLMHGAAPPPLHNNPYANTLTYNNQLQQNLSVHNPAQAVQYHAAYHNAWLLGNSQHSYGSQHQHPPPPMGAEVPNYPVAPADQQHQVMPADQQQQPQPHGPPAMNPH
jgi:hypothetical protein